MERPPARVLLIDENREQALWIDSLFGRMAFHQWELSRVETADEALARLATCEFDVCIIDSRVGGDGLSLVRSARKSGCLKPIIVLIDGANAGRSAEAIETGATDCLFTDHLDAIRLERAVRYALDQQKLLRALEYERHLLHTLMDSIPDSIYFKDLEGRYLRVNRAKSRRSGLDDPSLAVGKSDLDFFPDEHARRTLEDERRVIESGQAIVGQEEQLVWPTGEVSWASTTKVPFRDEQGRIVGTLGLSRDITRLKAAQEAFREAKETAEAANRSKREFLSNISHEVRTPMNAILGMTELVLDSPLSPSQREYLRIAHESARSLLGILDDILDFSVIQSGKIELQSEPFSVRELVGDVVELLVLEREKRLNLQCKVREEVPEVLLGDSSRLRQLLVNVLGNAVKFTEAGRVAVDVSCETTDCDEVLLQVKVADTGVGIPADKLEAIFGAFQQADSSPTRRFGGTGLGLTISSHLVRLMNGRIQVESVPNVGSTFQFSLRLGRPAVTELVRDTPSVLSADRRGTGDVASRTAPSRRVLLAEGSLFNRKLAVGLLQKWGHVATVAADGFDAVEATAKGEFDLILMDVQMPRMDGCEAARAIRGREAQSGRRVPIVAMTANATKDDRDRCLEAGMDGYIAKPIDAQELQRIIEGIPRPASVQEDEGDVMPDNESSVDWDAAMAAVDGRADLLQELISIFFQEYPVLTEQIREAIQRGDAPTLRLMAHRLKGCLRYFGDNEAARHAWELEMRGRDDCWDGVPELQAQLQQAIEIMLPALRAFRP